MQLLSSVWNYYLNNKLTFNDTRARSDSFFWMHEDLWFIDYRYRCLFCLRMVANITTQLLHGQLVDVKLRSDMCQDEANSQWLPVSRVWLIIDQLTVMLRISGWLKLPSRSTQCDMEQHTRQGWTLFGMHLDSGSVLHWQSEIN